MLYGNLLSLPFGDGMLYVEPVYVKSNQQNAYPLLQKVLLSYGDGGRTCRWPTRSRRASRTWSPRANGPGRGSPNRRPDETPTTPTDPNAPTMSAELQAAANRVSTAIDKAREAQESGDFTAYGEALTELDAAMDAFQAAQRAAPDGGAGASPGATPAPASRRRGRHLGLRRAVRAAPRGWHPVLRVR